MFAQFFQHKDRSMTVHMARQIGFSLIELMIVVAVIGVLAAVAYPSYQQYITRTWRAAASACLTEMAQGMERRFTVNMSYAGLVDNDGSGTDDLLETGCTTADDMESRYQFSFKTGPTSASFALQALPQGVQQSDTACQGLTLDSFGRRAVTGTTTDAESCW